MGKFATADWNPKTGLFDTKQKTRLKIRDYFRYQWPNKFNVKNCNKFIINNKVLNYLKA